MYDRFDSGLFDASTSNAVALALSQIYREKVRVYRKRGNAVFVTSEGVQALPKSVETWLDQVDRGIPVQPFRFRL